MNTIEERIQKWTSIMEPLFSFNLTLPEFFFLLKLAMFYSFALLI